MWMRLGVRTTGYIGSVPLRQISALAGLLVVCTVFPSGAYAAADDAYRIEKKAFKKTIKSVALAPLNSPDALNLSDEMRDFIEAEVSKAFKKTKVDALPIAEYAQVRTLFAEQIGGVRNAAGAVDINRRTVVWDHAKREMRRRHPVDGFAEIALRVVSAPFSDDRAEWDGVKRKLKSSGDGFFGGKDYSGNIAAVSFQLAIFDRSDALVYLKRGGVDVMHERQAEQLVLRTDDYLSDPKRLKKAVQMAFKPL